MCHPLFTLGLSMTMMDAKVSHHHSIGGVSPWHYTQILQIVLHAKCKVCPCMLCHFEREREISLLSWNARIWVICCAKCWWDLPSIVMTWPLASPWHAWVIVHHSCRALRALVRRHRQPSCTNAVRERGRVTCLLSLTNKSKILEYGMCVVGLQVATIACMV